MRRLECKFSLPFVSTSVLTASLTRPAFCSAAGEYSGAGATTCSQCPKGQYSPSSGLGDQQELVGSSIPCLRCPKGSIALAAGQSISEVAYVPGATDDYRNELALSDKATHCEAW